MDRFGYTQQNFREALDAAALNKTAVSPIGGAAVPLVELTAGDPDWVMTVCEICAATVFTVNVDPHKAWHERNRG